MTAAPPAMAGLQFVDAAALADAGSDNALVVVAFVATWNRRCQGFAADYQAWAERCGPALPVLCVDVDEHPGLVTAHAVFSVPTVLVLRSGQEIGRETGTDLPAVQVIVRAEAERGAS